MSGAALLAEVWRGDVCEAAVRGHVAVVSADNRLLASCGDADARTTVRSTVKPLQALPFVCDGAADALGATVEEVAVACASHDGEPRHVEAVRRLLSRAGLDESALSCGPQWPYSESASRALAAAGEKARAVHNNCSGKHAAMLCACVHAGWPVDGYAAYDHPLQRDIRRRMSEYAGIRLADTPHGIDGCGLPTHGVTLRYLARMFAAASAADAGFRRCQDAMAAEPFMVGGGGRFDTLLLSWAGTSLTAKSGGAAVWACVVRGGGPGVAIKLEAGLAASLPPIAMAVLRALDLLPLSSMPDELEAQSEGALRNWAGEVVGSTRVQVHLERA
ncbi:MAG TPA: asparaginase [Candidatus Angelobacter sp.]|nr:asparaginase [Candidatus Angelobacter sp.]